MNNKVLRLSPAFLLLLGLSLVSGCGPAIIVGVILGVAGSGGDGGGCEIAGTEVEVTVGGTVLFEKRREDPTSGPTQMVPVEGARVEVLRLNCGNEVIASTSTASDGSYQVTFRTESGSVLRVAVLSQMEDASMPVTVRNNRTEKLILSMESKNMSLGGEPTQDLSPVDFDVFMDCNFQLAGAFNILRATRLGFEAIAGELASPPPALTVFWSLGSPEGTFFSTSLSTEDLTGDGVGQDAFIQLRGGAFLPGFRNTDHFDDGIILHEFGHYVIHVLSRDDSPGGAHAFAELLDPRVAWSEGAADFLSCLARGSPVIFDTLEELSSCGTNFALVAVNLETKDGCLPTICCVGIGSEETVAAFLWDTFDGAADAGDAVEIAASDIFMALKLLPGRHFVYIGDFVEELEAIAAQLAPPQDGAIRALAQREGIADGGGSLVPFPSAFSSQSGSGNSLQAMASDSVNGCDADPCRSNVVSFIGSSDFYELLVPGTPGVAGILEGQLTITGGPPTTCSADLNLRIFNQPQNLFFTTEGVTGSSKILRFGFDADFVRGSYLLVEVAGDVGEGQKGNYVVTINIE